MKMDICIVKECINLNKILAFLFIISKQIKLPVAPPLAMEPTELPFVAVPIWSQAGFELPKQLFKKSFPGLKLWWLEEWQMGLFVFAISIKLLVAGLMAELARLQQLVE